MSGAGFALYLYHFAQNQLGINLAMRKNEMTIDKFFDTRITGNQSSCIQTLARHVRTPFYTMKQLNFCQEEAKYHIFPPWKFYFY